MSSRPRRAAAQRAYKTMTDMVVSDNVTSSRTGKIMSSRSSRRTEGKSAAASLSRGHPSLPSDSDDHVHLTVKLPASKLRQATSSNTVRENFSGGEIVEGKRSRAQKKSYVVETSEDEEEEDEDAEGDDDDMMDDDEEDAEGEIVVDDTMDIDAEGDDDDEDAEGEDDDMDMSVIPPPAPVVKVSKPPVKKKGTAKAKTTAKPAASRASAAHAKDSDDEELSELDSDVDDIQDTVNVGGGDEDAEGEDEDIEEEEPAGDDGLGSDEEGSQDEIPDLTKMTKRQRARFEENEEGLLKLSDEVQAKKVFTAEELSMRRAEMARRRRNLSDKRNEEVKMETINKLLKKQAPKTKGKGQAGLDELSERDGQKPSPIFVRWVSNKDGCRVSVPEEIMAGPAGNVFVKPKA
ncbi:PAPA-1-like conserved region-domain-containing protein [Astrocystis sublimbata]|nr:PAPA-1-like conserved region-domain-containing protein [Astrocystis sublimbata]